jgi:uncharacterized protein DUF3455
MDMNHWGAGRAAWAAILAVLVGCAAAPTVKPDDIPVPLRVTTGEVVAQKLHAVGTQVYRCRANKDDAARFEWQLEGPDAVLFDKPGHKFGRHYSGPTWEADDGSKVVGAVVARADAPQPAAVAWLLLRAKSTSGAGVFAGVRYVQRLHTVGGDAPHDGCAQATAEAEIRQPYSADYWFYVAKP